MRSIEELQQLPAERPPIQHPLEALLDPVEDRRLKIRKRDPQAVADAEPGCRVPAADVIGPLATARLLVRSEPLPAVTAHDQPAQEIRVMPRSPDPELSRAVLGLHRLPDPG